MRDGLLQELSESTAEAAARRLLGCYFIRDLQGQRLIGRIVETEAYDQADAASHSYRGPTPRTEVMFGPAGFLYVYFTYGMHYCCNVVCGPEGQGAAVLIRAMEPLQGQELMSFNRHGLKGSQLTNGPAKVCQAFAIDKQLTGHDLHQPPLFLEAQPAYLDEAIISTTRVGISKAKDELRRFYLRGNEYVSRPR